jgi:hypothetical protein
MNRLSARYDTPYDALLEAVGTRPGVKPTELAAFWPMIGHAYDGSLMVVGRAVNGWIDRVAVSDLAGPEARRSLLGTMRRTSEGDGQGCPMGWVTGAWGRGRGSYSTARSSFWRFIRAVLAAVDPASADDPAWSSRLAWSNLAKLAPWGSGNPWGPLLDVQRELGPALLATEIEELAPRRVLVLAGRWWFEPFAVQLDLAVDWRDGLVEGVADDSHRRWMIAPHPQGKPRELLPATIEAFASG